MVQVQKEEISRKIYEAARDEFYDKGFKGATLRNIASVAGIPVGLIYTYYKNKEELFNRIVAPLSSFFNEALTENDDSGEQGKPHDDSTLFNEMQQLLQVFKTHRMEFIIMIDKSRGTKYENTRELIISTTKEHIKVNLSAKIKEKNVDEFFYHILANNFMESIFEIARHYKDEEWAKRMVDLTARQYFYGVNSL